jgi:hypothetical protein
MCDIVRCEIGAGTIAAVAIGTLINIQMNKEEEL